MNIRIKNNMWTRIEWWDQLAHSDESVVLRNVGPKNKIKCELKLSQISHEDTLNLMNTLQMAVINGDSVFDVESWTNRIKKKKTRKKKTGEVNV